MSFFFNAEENVRKRIFEYLFTVDKAMEAFRESINPCLEEGKDKVLADSSKTHHLESKADDIAGEIARMLFGRTLLPEAKYDIMALLESIDRVPDAAETVLAKMECQRIFVPEELKPAFRVLVDNNIEAFRYLQKTSEALFNTPSHTLEMAQEVDKHESKVDHLERKLIKEIFDSSREKADKLILLNLITQICSISDRAENAADRLGLIAMKRKI